MKDAAERLMAALEADPVARLRWRVLAILGVCPLSPRALLLTKRRALRYACHLALDLAARAPARDAAAEGNPNFDMARYLALGGLSDGV